MDPNMHPQSYEQLILKNGGHIDFWLTNLEYIKDYIKKNKIQPVDTRYLYKREIPVARPVLVENIAIEFKNIKPIDFPGGLKTPHLHFGNDIYLLSAEQWKGFSAVIMKNFQKKLSQIQTVPFEPLMKMDSAISPLV